LLFYTFYHTCSVSVQVPLQVSSLNKDSMTVLIIVNNTVLSIWYYILYKKYSWRWRIHTWNFAHRYHDVVSVKAVYFVWLSEIWFLKWISFYMQIWRINAAIFLQSYYDDIRCRGLSDPVRFMVEPHFSPPSREIFLIIIKPNFQC